MQGTYLDPNSKILDFQIEGSLGEEVVICDVTAFNVLWLMFAKMHGCGSSAFVENQMLQLITRNTLYLVSFSFTCYKSHHC